MLVWYVKAVQTTQQHLHAFKFSSTSLVMDLVLLLAEQIYLPNQACLHQAAVRPRPNEEGCATTGQCNREASCLADTSRTFVDSL